MKAKEKRRVFLEENIRELLSGLENEGQENWLRVDTELGEVVLEMHLLYGEIFEGAAGVDYTVYTPEGEEMDGGQCGLLEGGSFEERFESIFSFMLDSYVHEIHIIDCPAWAE